MLNNCYKAIGNDCIVYLCSYGILCVTPESLYFHMLLKPFKEKFNPPLVFYNVLQFVAEINL